MQTLAELNSNPESKFIYVDRWTKLKHLRDRKYPDWGRRHCHGLKGFKRANAARVKNFKSTLDTTLVKQARMAARREFREEVKRARREAQQTTFISAGPAS